MNTFSFHYRALLSLSSSLHLLPFFTCFNSQFSKIGKISSNHLSLVPCAPSRVTFNDKYLTVQFDDNLTFIYIARVHVLTHDSIQEQHKIDENFNRNIF